MAGSLSPRLFLAVLAGGRSTRASQGDASAPKQFREVSGDMVLVHGLRELARAPGLVQMVLVVPDPWRSLVSEALTRSGLAVPWTLAGAGDHRTASTWSALRALAALPQGSRPVADDLVAVHDAARPFASHHLLERVATAAASHGAAVPGVAVPDTIVELTTADTLPDVARPVAGYLDRERLAALQTPQVARWRELYEAHAWAAVQGIDFTDDGGLLAACGLLPVVVMGEVGNWKITTDDDWRRAATIFAGRTP